MKLVPLIEFIMTTLLLIVRIRGWVPSKLSHISSEISNKQPKRPCVIDSKHAKHYSTNANIWRYARKALSHSSYLAAATITNDSKVNASLGVKIDDLPVVVIEKGKAKLFQYGNPIVFSGAVKEVIGSPAMADEVVVTDYMGNLIGRGLFNPVSIYRVRMLSRNYESLFFSPIADIIEERIEIAKKLRLSLKLPEKNVNTVYRLVNGEGDRLGGLIIDVIGTSIIIQSSACWVERYKAIIITAVERAMNDPSHHDGALIYTIIWRQVENHLKLDGYQSISPSQSKESPSIDRHEVVYENGIKFKVYPESNGQKTGFFCDQRENRRKVGQLAKNKEVLDCYSYSGGFSLMSAIHGAKSVIAVDSSQIALDLLRDNIELNRETMMNGGCSHIEVIKADAVEYMNELAKQGKSFDIVIVDPPKLAPNRNSLEKAKGKYIKVNSVAISLVKPGGLLFTCSCSGAVAQSNDEFMYIIADAAKIAKREVTVLSASTAGPDHPVHIGYKESQYLSTLLLRII